MGRCYTPETRDAVHADLTAGLPIEDISSQRADAKGPIPLGTLRRWAVEWGLQTVSHKTAGASDPAQRRGKAPLEVNARALIREALDRRLLALATGEPGTTKTKNMAIEVKVLAESFGEVLRAREDGSEEDRRVSDQAERRKHIAKTFGVTIEDGKPPLKLARG